MRMLRVPRSSGRPRWLAAAVCALSLLRVAGASGGPSGPANRPSPTLLPGTDIRLLPEPERTMERLVLGLDVNRTKYFMLPETTPWDPKTPDPRVRYLRRQLYGLNFELRHGGILKAVPEYTRVFVAVPEPGSSQDGLGNEEIVFREYLKTRVGWDEPTISRRVRFFRVPSSIPFPRDMAVPLGRDSKERLVLGLGEDTDAYYMEPVRRLVAAFPEEFVLRVLPQVNAEGGDLSLERLPDGAVGLVVGYHRIRRYLESARRLPDDGRPVPQALIEEGRAAFRRAFFGVEVLVLGEEALRDPALGGQELIHADMVFNAFEGASGPVAFVPSYGELQAVDAILRAPVPEAVRKRAQDEYDRAARQLERRGYRVVRLPFRDHPDRTPVQVGDFVDKRTAQQFSLLGKYPYHLDLPGGRNPQQELQETLSRLEDAVAVWRKTPTDARWRDLVRQIAGVWSEMDRAAGSPNPSFETQSRLYEAEGIRVIAVPIYPTGEGGLHCLLLN